MKFDNETLVRALAADYVCGAMTVATRRRFEALRLVHAEFDAAVAQWDAVLLPMALNLRPVQPPVSVLARIEAALGLPSSPSRLPAPTLEQIIQQTPSFRLVHHRHRQAQHGGGCLLR